VLSCESLRTADADRTGKNSPAKTAAINTVIRRRCIRQIVPVASERCKTIKQKEKPGVIQKDQAITFDTSQFEEALFDKPFRTTILRLFAGLSRKLPEAFPGHTIQSDNNL
jgi:hypothetical protein